MSSADSSITQKDRIVNSIKLFFQPGEVWELRIPKAGRYGTASGYFNDPEAFAKAVLKYNGKAPGIYFTLNPVNPALLARANSRVIERVTLTTGDHDIICRRWLPVDIDPVRPAGISSSDAEHSLALERAKAIREYLRKQDWPEPLMADSGNGAHLLYKIDLPNDDESRDLVKSTLEALDFLFSDEKAKIDITVYNAARIWKVYGSLSCKGESIADRPHRPARVIGGPGYGV